MHAFEFTALLGKGENKKVMESADDTKLCGKVKSAEKSKKLFHNTKHKQSSKQNSLLINAE